ncbi:MAG: response regulator [Lachnospiraceae bacterium]|nr:response regulator [Lachnospiraceae bacterium]
MAGSLNLRSILLVIQYICIIGSFIESLIIVRRLKTNLNVYLFLSCIALLINETGYLLELIARSEGELLNGIRFSYFGRVWYAYFMLLFVAELVRIKLPVAVKYILTAIHFMIYLVILTMDRHRLYYSWVELDMDGMFTRFSHGNGIVHDIFMSMQMIFIVLGLFWLIRAYLRQKRGKTGRRLFTVILAIVTQSVFLILQLHGIKGITNYYDLTMFGFFIGTILMFIAIISFDLLETTDIAKEFVIDRLSEIIIAVDANGIIRYFNKPAEEIYPELGALKDKAMESGEGNVLSDIIQAIEEDKSINIGDRIYSPEVNELVYGGESVGKIYALMDDTEHYRYMEELREQKEIADNANEAKSRFLANMSHEIRTPINALLGMDEMILRESQEKNIRAYASDIMSAGRTLLSLINDILDFSKVEEGKMEIIPVQYELSALINDLVNMISLKAAKKGLELKLDINEHIPHLLFGDEIRIRQCVMNILTNAVKYTEKGSVTMRVGYSFTEDETGIKLSFQIEDTGIGMKKEDMERLFSPYERIEEKRNRTIEGTGLGMSITAELLKLMGSTLEVKSDYGRGSTFYFEVEQKVLSYDELGDYTHKTESADRGGEVYHELFHAPDAHILVVDDTEINLTVIKSLLKQTGIGIDTALSGKDALGLVKIKDYDVIFIDHMMPEMDGIETLENLRRDEKNKDVPVVALTANAVSGAREMFLNAGFNDYLSKPVDGIMLERMLMHLLPGDKVYRQSQNKAVKKEKNISTRSRIFAIDDDEAVCELICRILESDYDVKTSLTGENAVSQIRDYLPDLILLDINLSDVSGFEVLEEIKRDEAVSDIPVLLVTGLDDSVAEENGFKSGASDYIRKPFDPEVLRQRVRHTVDLYHYQQSIEEEVKRQTVKSRRLTRDMMLSLSKAVDIKDHYTDGHSRRVAAICAEIGRRLGKSDEEQIGLYESGLLHDIGKIGIHEDIIHKDTKLTDDEFFEVKQHTLKGYDILKEITGMPKLRDVARWHHERFDGTGYPDGLKGDKIPENARIACVADCYDAMTSTRTYSTPKRQEDVRAEIKRCRGTWFDPRIADVMLLMIDEDVSYKMNENAQGGDVWREYERLWGNLDAYETVKETDTRAEEGERVKEELPEWIKEISVIDTDSGLKNCGSVEGYLSVMNVFRQTAKAKADEIESLYENKDIPGYTIKVHALKSSARIIGAKELSKLAESLENAGKENNTDFMDENTGRLLFMYRDLEEKLSLSGDDKEELPLIEPQAMKEAYQTVTEIAGSMDYGMLEELLKDIRKYRLEAEDDKKIKEIESRLNDLDWEGIINAAGSN